VKVTIRYHSSYRYPEPVAFSPHTFRILPKADRFFVVQQLAFETNADTDVQFRRDLFDNEVAYCFYRERSADLHIEMRATLDVQEKNPFHFLLESRAVDFPFSYDEREREVLAPFLKNEGGTPFELPFWKPEPKPTVTALIDLNESIFKNIHYQRRETGGPHSPHETLRLGVGACRDLAVLLAAALRGAGVASRLVSGYLCEFGGGEKKALNALHAWTEAYLPGAGWIGFDPTNGIFCNHNHLATAVGLTPADITPVTGSFYGKRMPAEMSLSIELAPAEDEAALVTDARG